MYIQSYDFKQISPDLEQSAARLAAKAYFDNPAHIYLCPDENVRLQQVEWLLGLNLKLQLKYGAKSFCYPENGEVLAMGFWTKPNEIKIDTFSKIKAGLLRIPFHMGWNGFKRVMETSATIDKQLQKSIGSQINYHYLNNMVMEERHRAKGWGTAILEKQFELIAEIEPKAVLALTTQRYWTVKFYVKLGFEVILEESIGDGPLAFTNWTMKMTL